jgi:diguanylate cyclase (GGDEF)-like protein
VDLEAALREADDRYRRLVEHSSDAIGISAEGRLVSTNPAAAALLRTVDPGSMEVAWETVQHAVGRLRTEEEVASVDCRVLSTHGEDLHLEVLASRVRWHGVDAVQLLVRDVTAKRKTAAVVAHSATHDHLTGLPNRALLVQRLGAVLRRRDPRSGPVAVLFVDLDRFKVVNESLGHELGDELLVLVARRLAGAVDADALLARFGGDEFVIVLGMVQGPEPALSAAGQIALALDQPFAFGDHRLTLDASVGVALAVPGEASPDELIRDADAAMHRAKARGGARAALYDDGMREQAIQRLDIENGLRGAAERDELRVHYQPLVSIRTGRAVGAEALVRWVRPDGRMVSPAEFIPVAEETGLIGRIGSWVLAQACNQAHLWQLAVEGDSPLEMGVNVSGRQLGDPDLVPTVASVLNRPGQRLSLCLEITESVLLSAETLPVLHDLKGLGVRLAVDDFGTGYSSLASLRKYPVDVVKIDRQFITGIDTDPSARAVVKAIVEVTHALGMESLAEGVETREQLDVLGELGCDVAQGFLLARPAPAEDLVDRLWSPFVADLVTDLR